MLELGNTSQYVDQVYFGCLYCCFCIISSPPDHNFAVGYLVQVGLFYVVNDYLVVPTVSVDFMQPENVMVSQAVQCVARWNKLFFSPSFI